jgi:hypothetical protein
MIGRPVTLTLLSQLDPSGMPMADLARLARRIGRRHVTALRDALEQDWADPPGDGRPHLRT